MHDVLAHRISQVSMHASALAFRTDLDADEMRASATIIQDTAHEALADLRGVLGVLRDPESGEPLEPPQPTYADLGTLVEAVRSAGLKVSYDDRLGDAARAARRDRPHRLPDRPGGDDERREARARDGAADRGQRVARARVSTSSCATRSASVRVSTPGAGLGLVGLTERAELRGGRLEGRREDGAWVLRGWIPWAA